MCGCRWLLLGCSPFSTWPTTPPSASSSHCKHTSSSSLNPQDPTNPSSSTFGLYQSYFIAIACMLHARLTGRIPEAPWSLGRYGVVINIFALIYSAWLGIFMIFPSYLPITPSSMNYALPINALIWLIAIVSWFGWAEKNWAGLDVELINKIVADGERDTKE